MSDDEDSKDLLLDKASETQTVNKSKPRSQCDFFQFLYMCVLNSIVGLLFGYEAGLGIDNLSKIKESISLDCTEQNAIITSWIIGALISSVFGGLLVDKFGPRTILSFTSSLLFSCSLMSSIIDSFIVFLSFRIIAGFAGSLLLIAQYVFALETTVIKKYQLILLISVSSTVGYLILTFMSFTRISWRTEFELSSFLAFTTFAFLFLLHSSSYGVLLTSPKATTHTYSSKSLQTIILAITLATCCELMGHTTVRYYASIILGMFGVCTDYQQNMAVIILNNIRVISTLILIFTLDKLGKRCSIILGTLIMTITLILLGILSMNDVFNNTTIETNSVWSDQPENCHRVIIGTEMSYINEPFYTIQQNKNMENPLNTNDDKTPYPFLPTPLAFTSEIDANSGINFLFNCKHDNDQWYDESLPSKAAKLILIFLYESGNALSGSFMYWIVFCDIAPRFMRGKLLGAMIGVHWLSGLIAQSTLTNFIGTFTLSGMFFLHSFACLISLFVSFLFLPEDHIVLNNERFYFHSMLNNLRCIPGFGKSENTSQKSSQSTAI